MKLKDKKSEQTDHEDELLSTHKHKSSSAKQAETQSPGNSIEYTGLCVNCDKRTFCRFCNQPGGVWYCEEYE